jgi:hypothetical protein
MLRNPIKRTWSHAAMHFERWRQGLVNAGDKDIQAFFEEGRGDADSDYLRVLNAWEQFYPQDQFYVAFLDAVAEDARVFLQDLYRFLGLDPERHSIPDDAGKRLHARNYPPMPNDVGRYLARKYYPQIEQLHQRFDNRYTSNWLAYAEQYL